MYLFCKIDSTLLYYAFCDCMPHYFHFEGVLVIHARHTHDPVKKWWKKSKILFSGLLSEKMRSSLHTIFFPFLYLQRLIENIYSKQNLSKIIGL